MGVVASLEKPDALTDVLDMLKPRGRVFCCSELSAPWAMSLPADGYVRIHVIERGGAWLRVEDAKQLTPLASGDLVIVPHGSGHSPRGQPENETRPDQPPDQGQHGFGHLVAARRRRGANADDLLLLPIRKRRL